MRFSLALGVFSGLILAKLDILEVIGGSWGLSHSTRGVSFRLASAVSQPTHDRPSPLFSRLRRIPSQGAGRQSVAVHLLRPNPLHSLDRSLTSSNETFQSISAVGDFSTQYAIQCGWDGVPVWLLVDTGSADTWAAKSDFECRDSAGRRHEQLACVFGNPLIDDFGGGSIDDLHFRLQYGDDEIAWGPMGYSDISCGGIEVPRQQVGLANHTYWHGDNTSVGILGLAYPSVTSAYYGAFGDEAEYNAVHYNPFFTNAITQGLIDPVFSVAMMKNSSDGVLAWGGLPPMDLHGSTHAETDLIIANLIDRTDTSWRYSFYTIIPDGIRWNQTIDKGKYPYIVDTGTTLMYLPPPLAELVAMAFDPPAEYLYRWGSYFAPCDATPPSFAIIISGVEFWIDPSHMIYPNLVDPVTGYCSIAVSSGQSGPYVLGDVFLQNVLAVFDIGGAQMRFYSRR